MIAVVAAATLVVIVPGAQAVAGAQTWSIAKGVQGGGDSGLMACADAGMQVDCVVGDSAYSTDGGATWNPSSAVASEVPAVSAPTVTSTIYQTACVSAAGTVDCVAVGALRDNVGDAYPLAIYTTDGGRHWAGGQVGISGGALQQVTCAMASGGVDCVSGPFYSTDGGVNWSILTGVVHGPPTCITSSPTVDCVSVGMQYSSSTQTETFEAAFSSDGGATWTPSSVPNVSYPGSGAPTYLSCATVVGGTDCTATTVGPDDQSTGLYSTDGGGHWSLATGPTQAYVSCWAATGSSAASCTSVSQRGATSYSRDGGATWTSGSSISEGPESIGSNDNYGTNTLACGS